MINSHSANQWDAQSVGSQHEDMSQALGQMVGNFQVSVNQEAAFLDEIEAEAEENGLEIYIYSNLSFCVNSLTLSLFQYPLFLSFQ